MAVPFSFFLAHASPDKPWARQLYEALAPEPCFLDAVTLRCGEIWDRGILEAQAASRATVVLVSRSAPEAYYLGEEIDRAIELFRKEDHRVFPVFLDGVPARSTEVPYGLYRLNRLDGLVLGPNGVADALRTALHGVPATAIGAPPTVAPGRATKIQLYQAACRLLPSMLDELATMHLEAPTEHFRSATRAALAMDLVNWAKLEGEPAMSTLERYLRANVPSGPW